MTVALGALVMIGVLGLGARRFVRAAFTLDATELGDLLELASVEHIIGAESQAQTGEPHALPGAANPMDQQAISWCFALDHLPGEDHTIDKPADYAFWQSYRAPFWPGSLLSWEDVHPISSDGAGVDPVLMQIALDTPGSCVFIDNVALTSD